MADPRTKRYGKPFNVQLDETSRAMLNQLAEAEKVPASQIIRDSIDKRFRMTFNREPRCVTGGMCLCPVAHTGAQHSSKTSAELVAERRGANGAPTG